MTSVPESAAFAAEHGGRIDCVWLLAELGVFVLDRSRPHIQIDRAASRVPTPPDGWVRHWRESTAERDDIMAPIVEALAQAVRCQGIRAAIATMDSAWHLGLVGEDDIGAVFELLPRRYRRMRGLLDPRSESGPETLVRLMLRATGASIELQVLIDGVGRVDLVVDGWLVIECDSRAHHSSMEAQLNDRRRDLALAALGYCVLRLLAEDIMYHPDRVQAALRGILRNRRP